MGIEALSRAFTTDIQIPELHKGPTTPQLLLLSSLIMSIPETVPPFTKLDLPPPEEYHKRKVALVSGMVFVATRGHPN